MFRTGDFRCDPSQAARRLTSQSAALGLWVGQLASAPGAHPPEVSGVGSQLGFQVWAPSQLIWVRATGLQVSAQASFPRVHSPGTEGGGAPEAVAAMESSLISR